MSSKPESYKEAMEKARSALINEEVARYGKRLLKFGIIGMGVFYFIAMGLTAAEQTPHMMIILMGAFPVGLPGGMFGFVWVTNGMDMRTTWVIVGVGSTIMGYINGRIWQHLFAEITKESYKIAGMDIVDFGGIASALIALLMISAMLSLAKVHKEHMEEFKNAPDFETKVREHAEVMDKH